MQKQNILILVSDQLAQRAVGCYGNNEVNTPTIDSLATGGMRFDNAYTPFPLCCPARASFWTSQLPHSTNVLSNGREWPIENIAPEMPTLGELFSEAGYETVHFGKTHDAGSLKGFNCAPEEEIKTPGSECWPTDYDTHRDAFTVQESVNYLQQEHDKPFLMVADIQNPHDICNWVGSFAYEHEDIAPPVALPTLPDNFEISDWEALPYPVQHICCSHNRLSQAAVWNRENYQHYLAAYYHYIERADNDFKTILDALESSDAADNTLVLFFADHGDGMTAHRMVTKQVQFYDECSCVPLIFNGPGVEPGVNDSLVSLCDIVPTLCDYAGIESPVGIYGQSILPALKGEGMAERGFVVSEWVTEWGFTVSPGRMVRTENYKYMHYREDDGEEFYDMVNDPGETRNLVYDPSFIEVLKEHRAILADHIEDSKDNYYELPIHRSMKPSHEVGYQNHRGPAAPMLG